MGTICAIHQPNFFPRLSTLAKLYRADCWVVLDDVQFVRRDYQNRARLAAPQDPDIQQWLSLPVHLPDGRATKIREVVLAEPAKSHRRAAGLIQQFYGRTPHWNALKLSVDQALEEFPAGRLHRVAEGSTRVLLSLLGWRGTVLHSSTLPARNERTERLVDLTIAAGCQTYLCGTGGARYLDPRRFADRNVRVEYFGTPDTGLWRAARRVTALWALSAAGPCALSSALRQRPGDHHRTSLP